MSFQPLYAFRRAVRLGVVLLATAAGLPISTSPARAFDQAGFKAKLDLTLEELKAKSLANSAATLARLDELIAIGSQAAKEYGSAQPKYATLMAAVVADAGAMKSMTDNELEDKWGEKGSGGDAAGVPLISLGQWDAQRNYLELVVAPASAYGHIKKWTSGRKTHWIEQARDELGELSQHLARM